MQVRRCGADRALLPFTIRCPDCGQWSDVSKRTVLNNLGTLDVRCDLNEAKTG